MKEIDLSTMTRYEYLNLPALEVRELLRVHHRQWNFETGWNNILQVALYQRGPEVSEVGSTWLQNLNDMHALRPFHKGELDFFGGQAAFLRSAWPPEVLSPTAGEAVFSIPWMLDTRIFCYRRDLLARAGVAEQGAFASPEAVLDTLSRLRAAGVAYPLSLATGGLTLHNLASWVWGRGGAFRSDDYRKLALNEPEARRGLVDLFSLHPFIDPQARGLGYTAAEEHFTAGHSAVLFSGQWVLPRIRARAAGVEPVVAETVGCAPPPGVPYVGSTHLVVWRHTLQESEALRLIDHLHSPEVLGQIISRAGNFPARVEVLDSPMISADPDYVMVRDCLRRGRNFRSARLWAGVEVRLNALFEQLWADLFTDPGLELEKEIDARVSETAARLERTLLAN